MNQAIPSPSASSLRQVALDIRDELATRQPYPPGPTRFSLRRTHQLVVDPLPLLLSLYEEYGPVFTVRGLHRREVFLLGPEANHYVTVSHADNFSWRRGHFGELAPLLGDGLLTTDGETHDRARRIMMPAFHRDRLCAAVETVVEEAARALADWRPGATVDVYEWGRELALRISMRALLGLDPNAGGSGHGAAEQFERALRYYATDAWVRVMRGPGTPWRRMERARRRLDRIVYAELERRRGDADPTREDLLGLLLAARDDEGSGLGDRELRDHLVTLMFAGHDTSSSTLAFLLYELSRHPAALARVLAEQDEVLAGRPPTAEQLLGGLPQLDMALDETLRLYPPAWVGPRRAIEAFELAGRRVPAGAYVAYCSWASHRLPDVFEDPDAFVPERFAAGERRRLPRGAYVPFGGGSRICIGKRFGQMVVKGVATLALQRFSFALPPRHELRLFLMPTIGPRGGLPMVVSHRP